MEKNKKINCKTVKFGGSSLADAEQFKKVRDIILADPDRRYVVPSAPGKRFSSDKKVTDLFYKCYELCGSTDEFEKVFTEIKSRFDGIIKDLGLNLCLDEDYEKIKNSIKNLSGRDYAASRGEYLNGKILAKYLDFDFIDAYDVIFFSDNGNFDQEKTFAVLSSEIHRHKKAVIPGFYGRMPNGTVRTFSRGGSDVTGSIVARASNSDLYENWTDVSGFLSADPRIVDDPYPIETITYRELRELSYMGATVLHEDAVFPVRTAGIPINIRNTNRPEDNGTMIVPDFPSGGRGVITGIAGKHGFSVIGIEKDRLNLYPGVVRKVLTILESCGVSCEHMPSGIDAMSFVVSTDELRDKRELVINNLCATIEPDSVSVVDGLSLIAVVGRNMINAKGTASRIFTAVANAGVNIRMIDQGSDEINVIFGVNDEDYEKSINAIYDEFVRYAR